MHLQGVGQRLSAESASRPVDVTIVIVNWNTRQMLADCLNSVIAGATDEKYELIVVDNASSDGSCEMIASDFPSVRLIRNAENRGFAAANNQGIVVSDGRYVLLLNSDTLVSPGAIAATLTFADQNPDAAVVSCRVTGPRGGTQNVCYTFPSLLNLALSLAKLSLLFPRSRFFGRYRLSWWNYDQPRVVDAVAGCYMFVRREAIDEVGPLDECYFMYSEDVDWCWRFAQRGWKTMFAPVASIIHFGQASSCQCASDMHLQERQSLLMFLESKSGGLARHLANAMFCLGSLLRIPAAALQELAGRNRKQAADRRRLSLAALRYHLSGKWPATSTAAPK